MSNSEEMVAHGRTVEEIAVELGCDLLSPTSPLETHEAIRSGRDTHCDASLHRRLPAQRTAERGQRKVRSGERVADGAGLGTKQRKDCVERTARAGRGATVTVPVDLTGALQEHFGFDSFRPGQREACEAALEGRDTLVVMPIGSASRSATSFPRWWDLILTVVVSPLVSLMQDQVDGLAEVAPGAVAPVNAQQDAAVNREALERAVAGDLRLLCYVAPERFASAGFAERLHDASVGLFVVDEAHCVSEWGHDFRPDYFRLADAARYLGARAIFAATATATPQVAGDIVRRLGLRDAVRITTGFDRPNLSFAVTLPVSSLRGQACPLVEAALSEEGAFLPAIVYARARARAATRLRGVPCAAAWRGGCRLPRWFGPR